VAKKKSSKQTGSSKSSEPSMDELLAKFGGKVKTLTRGDKVSGKVIDIGKKRVVIDIGGKGEAIVAEKAYAESRDFIKTLEVGDEVSARVIVGETPEGFTIVSLRDAAQEAGWKKLEKAYNEEKPVAVVGKDAIQSGLTVDVEGMVGFIPGSQLGKDVAKNPSSFVGEHFKVKIIELNREERKIVLSEREVSEVEDIKLAKEAYEKVKEGEVYEGVVTTLANFGGFVRIDVPVNKKKIGLEGLVHISELSWGKVGEASDFISEGDKVRVKVIGKTDSGGKAGYGKLALSVKQALEDPWMKAAKKYKVDSKHKGVVRKKSDFGVFVELEEGVEGLIHMTKIPPGKKLSIGEEVNVYVEGIDSESKKLSLGLVLTVKPVGYK